MSPAIREALWSEDDMLALREFLASNTGAKLALVVSRAKPALLGAGDTNAVLIRSGEVRGFEQALTELLMLQAPLEKPAPPGSNFPPLEDDAAWVQ